MEKRKFTSNASVLLALAACLSWSANEAAEARLGESIATFKEKIKGQFTYKQQSVKDNKSFLVYTMLLPTETQTAVPGFSGGLTITVQNGKVVGQSMMMRPGDNESAGKVMIALHALDFALESLGHPPPKTKAEAQKEMDTYSTIIDKARDGVPQNIRYPNIKGRVTITSKPDGSVLLAATLD